MEHIKKSNLLWTLKNIDFMKDKKLYVFIGILLIVLDGLYWILGVHHNVVDKSHEEKYTELKFERDTLGLGQVRLGESIEVSFKYTNIGDLPLIIKNVQTSCGCTEAKWSREPLASLDSGEVKVTFKAENEGHFMKSIFVVCNIWKKVYQLHINGEVFNNQSI